MSGYADQVGTERAGDGYGLEEVGYPGLAKLKAVAGAAIDQAVSRNTNLIEDLSKTIYALCENLSSVSNKPEYAEDDGPLPEYEGKSLVASKLNSQAYELQRLIRFVERMTQELEI